LEMPGWSLVNLLMELPLNGDGPLVGWVILVLLCTLCSDGRHKGVQFGKKQEL